MATPRRPSGTRRRVDDRGEVLRCLQCGGKSGVRAEDERLFVRLGAVEPPLHLCQDCVELAAELLTQARKERSAS